MQIGTFKAQADSSCVIHWHFLLKFSAQKRSLKGTWNAVTLWGEIQFQPQRQYYTEQEIFLSVSMERIRHSWLVGFVSMAGQVPADLLPRSSVSGIYLTILQFPFGICSRFSFPWKPGHSWRRRMGEMLRTLFQPDMDLGHEQKTTPEPDTYLFFFFFLAS